VYGRHASFMRHLKNMRTTINTKYAADMCGNMTQNCLKATTPCRSTGVRTHGYIQSKPMVEYRNIIEIGNRSANNNKNCRRKCQFMRKKYAICALCWNMRKNAAISEISGNSIGPTCMKLGLATGFTGCGGPAYWRYLAITVKQRCGFVSYRPTFFDHVLVIGWVVVD